MNTDRPTTTARNAMMRLPTEVSSVGDGGGAAGDALTARSNCSVVSVKAGLIAGFHPSWCPTCLVAAAPPPKCHTAKSQMPWEEEPAR